MCDLKEIFKKCCPTIYSRQQWYPHILIGLLKFTSNLYLELMNDIGKKTWQHTFEVYFDSI